MPCVNESFYLFSFEIHFLPFFFFSFFFEFSSFLDLFLTLTESNDSFIVEVKSNLNGHVLHREKANEKVVFNEDGIVIALSVEDQPSVSLMLMLIAVNGRMDAGVRREHSESFLGLGIPAINLHEDDQRAFLISSVNLEVRRL
jgi:hypothetical protein